MDRVFGSWTYWRCICASCCFDRRCMIKREEGRAFSIVGVGDISRILLVAQHVFVRLMC